MAVSAVYIHYTHIARFDGKVTLDAPGLLSNISSTSAAFHLSGGKYAIDVVGATFGTVTIQKLGADGTTYVDIKMYFDNGGTEKDDVIGSYAANGSKVFDLSAGTYKFVLA